MKLQPVKAESFTLDSNLPYELVFVSVRMPGTDSPDFAAAHILADVVSSQRAELYGSGSGGQSIGDGFRDLAETYPIASVGFAAAAIPAGSDPAPITAEMKRILAGYAEKGVPPELVEAARKGEIAGAEFQQNSISDLASIWAQALAAEGRTSPTELVDAMKKVTVEDVNRVAKKYLTMSDAIVATLKPSPSGEAVSSKGFGGAETTTVAPTKPVVLPDWAEASVKSLKLPPAMQHAIRCYFAERTPADRADGKGQPDHYFDRLVKHDADLQTSPGKDGVGRSAFGVVFLWHGHARPAGIPEGPRRHRRIRERRSRIQPESAEAIFQQGRGTAGGQRTSSRPPCR